MTCNPGMAECRANFPEEGTPQTVVLNLGRMSESPAQAFKNSKVRPHPPDIQILIDLWQSLGTGISLNRPVVVMCIRVENCWPK